MGHIVHTRQKPRPSGHWRACGVGVTPYCKKSADITRAGLSYAILHTRVRSPTRRAIGAAVGSVSPLTVKMSALYARRIVVSHIVRTRQKPRPSGHWRACGVGVTP